MRIATTAPQQTPRPAAKPTAHAHSTDPALARVLFDVWAGDPIVTVDSPPGAGKTRLITHLAHQLTTRAGLRVAIAAQTRVQALDVANRIAALDAEVTLLDGKDEPRPSQMHPAVTHLRGPRSLSHVAGVIVANTARWQWTPDNAVRADVLLVDEAYQCTYATLLALGSLAPQVVLVGDPGQIDPVVTGATSRWAGSKTAPHLRAPTGLAHAYPDDSITRHQLTHTWRCGPDTTALVQPVFYPDLPFTSARPVTHLLDGATKLPELASVPITAHGEGDPSIGRAAATRVHELLAARLVDRDYPTGRTLTGADIAVIAPHVQQASHVASLTADVPDLLIGTANAVQGAERPATIVIHPMTGQHTVTDFNCDLGRTCVALTRHRAHATILTDPQATRLLSQVENNHPNAAAQRALLEAITTT